MSLLTIQRSPSNSNSISSSSDSGGVRESEENQRICKSLNECYFAGKGTALMLGSNERLQRQTFSDGRRLSQISIELSASQTSIGSVGSDIQQHLQSMFYLLRPEETLKMAVKLESLRAGRTRYLVVVSRPASKKAQITSPTNTIVGNNDRSKCASPTINNSNSNNQLPSLMSDVVISHTDANENENDDNNRCSSSSILTTSYQNQSNTNSSVSSQTSANMTNANANAETSCDIDPQKNSNSNNNYNNNFTQCSNIQDDIQQCDNESTIGSSCSSKSSSNEIEESCLLGIDCNEKTTVGLVLKVLADTAIRLDGDGGFSVSVCGRQHIFKPVSVQAMWSALQTLYKISSKAHEHNFFSGGQSHDWVQYYENRIESERSCLNEWHAMDSIESRRPPSPDTIRNKPTERDETERVIRTALKEIMMSVDLDEVTSKYIRGRLEEHLDMDLGEFKSFIDEEMLVILGQMDSPTEIFEHVYLGSEWNASNLEELQRNGVGHILNVTREIDNFFPGMFDYCNVRVYDDEKTDLLKHWDNTFKYINRAKMEGSKVLVHCKMGISRSASVVVAYAMKAYNWDFSRAIQHVKEKRNCIKPNKNFLAQLETYQGILDAMKNKEKLQRSKSETNLKTDNAKDGKSLPGSEPTPLIQALQHNKNSTYPSSKKEANYLKRIHQRPSSSPDISKSASETLSIAKPLSISLETLVTVDVQEQQTCVSETTNLRWPSKNGHYSVSQNQIIYLENESANNSLIAGSQEDTTTIEMNKTVPLVRSIISELEQHHEKMKRKEEDLQDRETSQKKEPDIAEEVKPDQPQVYTCSAEIIRQDSFDTDNKLTTTAIKRSPSTKKEKDTFSKQVDRVFDREEKRQSRLEPTTLQQKDGTNFVSRQSSWSSVDSACIIGDLPSRNSSWGSGDNNRPSRNSSWGSYDTAKLVHPVTEDVIMIGGNFSYGKDDIPWYPGTVKRTKQKIEEKQSAPITRSSSSGSSSNNQQPMTIDAKNNNNNNNFNDSNNKILCDIKKSLLIDNLSNRTNNKGPSLSTSPKQPHKFAKLQQSSSVSSAAISSSKAHTRCKSEEYLTAQRAILSAVHRNNDRNNNRNSQPLSASAPETFCLNFIKNNRNIENEISTTSLKLQQRRHNLKKSATESCTDEQHVGDKKNKKENQQIGKVKNLKMNFEAKANNSSTNNNNNNNSNNNNNINNNNNNVNSVTYRENKKNSHSLPSSPIAIHIDVSESTGSGFPGSNLSDISSEDINVRGLVDRYEVGKIKTFVTPNIRQRPKSLYDPRFQLKTSQDKKAALMISHQTKGDDLKQRPPIPIQPIVKNALMTSNLNNVCSTKQSVGNCRRMQQGKTHPLSKLGINKQRINTSQATAYNTM
ncbi:protein phosphatase Slingshot isoform X2 [Chironomus tepperi]|uniref:protein phosphatase Slingshot isoform X2 n=1 Tax=Chironomus tepperi TaxID=113505 RepID=UPI00391F5C39